MEQSSFSVGTFLRAKALLAANIVILGAVAWGFRGEYLHNRDLQSQVSDLERKAAELSRDNVQLAAYGKTHDGEDTIERDARLKLGLQKPGEQVVVVRTAVRDTPAPAKPAAGDKPQETALLENARRWWKVFFGTDSGSGS